MQSKMDKLQEFFQKEKPDFKDFPVKEWEHFYKSDAFQKVMEFIDDVEPSSYKETLSELFGMALTSKDIFAFSERLADMYYVIKKLDGLIESLEMFRVTEVEF